MELPEIMRFVTMGLGIIGFLCGVIALVISR